jgi:hypothetical protein
MSDPSLPFPVGLGTGGVQAGVRKNTLRMSKLDL